MKFIYGCVNHMTEISLSTGEQIQLRSAPVRKFRGNLLPGSSLRKAEREEIIISIHEFEHPLFQISYLDFQILRELRLIIKEPNTGIRLEAGLRGASSIKLMDGTSNVLLSGQYQLSDTSLYQVEHKKGEHCSLISIRYQPALIASMGMGLITSVAPRQQPAAMKNLIYELLENPYDQLLRPFYYENCVRELLFLHLSVPTYNVPGELSTMDIAAIHTADRIIAEDLNTHLTIKQIARLSGTNSFILKKGFQQIFGMGVFQRLLQRRMERAKLLLEKTDKPIKDVCALAGYDTLAGFITAFRKRFGQTPREWRKSRRGES